MEKEKADIRSLEIHELQEKLEEQGEPGFRSKQIWDWIWRKDISSFAEIRNIPKSLIGTLESKFSFGRPTVVDVQKSSDGTIKCGFELSDGEFIEGVLIPTDSRITACISSQVGCSLSCAFCATGLLKRKRNLFSYEIYDQVFLLNRLSREVYGKPLSNIVYMGMGEPLLNYGQVLRSSRMINSKEGMGMSPTRITVSTAGITKMIDQLANDQPKFNLALSLHAANDEKRNKVMEINRTNDLQGLIKALNNFYSKTRNRITFEYIMLKDFNDSDTDAEELVQIARKVPSKVNLIEYNPVAGLPFAKTDPEKAERFRDYLVKNRIPASLRRSRGKDIDAACGQLAGKK